MSQFRAGRSAVLHLLPLAQGEAVRFKRHPNGLDDTLIAGGYPRIFDQKLDPSDWLRSYVATYIERDVRTISNVPDLVAFRRFVERWAGRTAQRLNNFSLAADCGISQPTAKAWLRIPAMLSVAFRLPTFRSNLLKRLVRMPKRHFCDRGLVCWVVGIHAPEQLRSHPLRGVIFESWVASEITQHRVIRGDLGGLSHFHDRDGVEADLVIEHPDRLMLVEAMSAQIDSPRLVDGVNRVRGHLDDPARPREVVVAYGGDASQRRSAAKLVSWGTLHEEKQVGIGCASCVLARRPRMAVMSSARSVLRVASAIALGDFTADSGATRRVPGSQR